MESRLPFRDFVGNGKGPFPRVGFLFCESELVRAVDPEISGLDPEEILEFPGYKTLVKGFPTGEPLVGELWLKYLALIVETTLENLNKIGMEYAEYKKSENFVANSTAEKAFLEADSWGEDLRGGLVSATTSIMIKVMAEGPKAFKVTSEGELTYIESYTDYTIENQQAVFLPKPAEKVPFALPIAISLISYWQRLGYSNIYCPIAALIGKMYDCGLFSLLPMFNTENLEQLRPLIQECRRVYGIEGVQYYVELFDMLLNDQESDEDSEELMSTSNAIVARMLTEEWFKAKQELPNEEEPEAEASEE